MHSKEMILGLQFPNFRPNPNMQVWVLFQKPKITNASEKPDASVAIRRLFKV